MGQRGFTVIELLIIIGFIALITYPILSWTGAGMDDRRPLALVSQLGFEEAKVIDRTFIFTNFKGCSSEDAGLYTIAAINPAKKPVTIGVCCGWFFKGCTIRGN